MHVYSCSYGIGDWSSQKRTKTYISAIISYIFYTM